MLSNLVAYAGRQYYRPSTSSVLIFMLLDANLHRNVGSVRLGTAYAYAVTTWTIGVQNGRIIRSQYESVPRSERQVFGEGCRLVHIIPKQKKRRYESSSCLAKGTRLHSAMGGVRNIFVHKC